MKYNDIPEDFILVSISIDFQVSLLPIIIEVLEYLFVKTELPTNHMLNILTWIGLSLEQNVSIQ